MSEPRGCEKMLYLGAEGGIWQAAAWFAVAIALLDSFDISLPRGDSIGVSGALVAASLLLFGPLPAASIALAGLLVSQLVGRHRAAFRALAEAAAVRLGALGITWAFAASGLWSPVSVPPLVAAVAVASVYLLAELVLSQAIAAHESGRPLSRLLRGNLSRQALMLAAQVSASALVVITYPDMGVWSLVPVVALLLLMRQSYAMLLEMRETYRATVEILVEAAEGQDSRLRGHADRTAQIAREICMRLGLSAAEVERASYSALLHDLYTIAGSFDVYEREDHGRSSTVLEGVEFFSDVLPIVRACDGTSEGEPPKDRTLLLAMVVALASDIDTARNPGAAQAHACSSVSKVSELLPGPAKARVVAAALELGYKIPAVS